MSTQECQCNCYGPLGIYGNKVTREHIFPHPVSTCSISYDIDGSPLLGNHGDAYIQGYKANVVVVHAWLDAGNNIRYRVTANP